jgi:hypothetical protein
MPNNKQKDADLASMLASGTHKHLSGSSTLAFDGGSFAPVQVENQLELIASLRADVESAKLAAKGKVAAEKAQLPALRAFMSAFIAFVKATFGNSPEVLADFGLAPKKARKPLTVEQQAAAKAKRESTRKARGTASKKQKAKVKGDVTGVTITPTTAPARPAQQSAAAPTGGSATPAPSHSTS